MPGVLIPAIASTYSRHNVFFLHPHTLNLITWIFLERSLYIVHQNLSVELVTTLLPQSVDAAVEGSEQGQVIDIHVGALRRLCAHLNLRFQLSDLIETFLHDVPVVCR